MHVLGRAAGAAVVGLVAGLLVATVAASWLRSATPEADLLWGAAPTGTVASWTMTGAHGTSLQVKAGVELDERVEKIGETIGGLIGRDADEGLPTPGGDFNVRLVPLTILVISALAVALVVRSAKVATVQDLAVAVGVSAVLYGAGLALIASMSTAGLGFDARIVKAGVDVHTSVPAALALGVFWGALFAAIGGVASMANAGKLPALWLAVLRALRRGVVVAVITAAVALVVLALTQLASGGKGPGDPSLMALGVVLVGMNVLGAAVVMSHGAPMRVSLDRGPLSDFTQVGYVYQGAGSISPARWLLLAVPIASGIAAGRVLRRHVAKSGYPIAAAAYGMVWAFVLALLAWLLRVDVLSSFSITKIEAGGGLAISPLIAGCLGFVWSAIFAYAGMVFGPSTAPAVVAYQATTPMPSAAPAVAPPVSPQPVAFSPVRQPSAQAELTYCGHCGSPGPVADAFCAACGKRR